MKRITMLALAVALVAVACGDDDTATVATTGTTATTTTTTEAAPDAIEPGATAAGDCPVADFLVDEVNAYEQTGGYPDPELEIVCGDGTFTVDTNNIPTFEFVAMTPNGLQAQDLAYEIPTTPVAADTPGAMGLGAVGVSVTGLNIFAAFEAPQDGYRDPFLDGLLDFCNGHTAPGGNYHFHARFDCIFDNPDTVGLVFGYIFDGYQLVSPWVCADAACTTTRKVTSSYQRTDPDGLGAFEAFTYVAGSGDLDECNGMVGADGVYRYHATDTFPYVPFCYHGVTSWAQGDFDGTAPAGGPQAGGQGAPGGQPAVLPPPPGRP